MTDTLPPKETPSSGLLQPRLVRLIELSRRVVDTSDEPECGCEYQHERCVAMDYRNAVRELESFKKEIDPNYRKCVGKLALAKNKNEAWAIADIKQSSNRTQPPHTKARTKIPFVFPSICEKITTPIYMNPPNHLPPYPEDPSIRLIRYFGQGMTEKDMNGADAFLVTIEGCDHWALRDCKYPQGVKTSYYARVWYTTSLRKGTILR